MRRVISIIKDKRTQYLIIVWILILKVIDIITNLPSKFQYLDFLKILGFGFLPAPSRFIWDVITALVGLWTVYRILKDVFNFSIIPRPLDKKELLSLSMLVIWFFSLTVTLLQFTTLVTTPLARPEVTISTYHPAAYNSRDIEIFGWYWIDWGSSYYDDDFKTIKEMFIDGVFLASDRYTFISRPEAFAEAIYAANKHGLKVGVIIFHPYDADFQMAWGLPKNQSVFVDFSDNETWIKEVYATKLKDIVAIGRSMGVSWYVYDDMSFDKASNLTNAQLFIDITYKITNNKTIMLSYYPPNEDISPFLNLSIMHWDWYTAPEDVDFIEDSLIKRPANNTSIGQFIWLHHKTGISFEDLQAVYDVLYDADRIEIFTLRYGDQTWSDAVTNSILENPMLVEYLTTLNLQVKYGEDLYGTVTLEEWETDDVLLDLSKSIFYDPISVYGIGEISEGGTKYIGASYFTTKSSPLGQKMIEMRFCGSGEDGVQGWFAYRVKLKHPIPVDGNTTLLLLLKLTPSLDGTAWAYYRMDISTKENTTYSLNWKFHDIPLNIVYKSEGGMKSNFLLGRTTEWSFYQFNINNAFYTSFSRKPAYITSIEYGVGAESDNEVKAQFLLAKISPQPLRINEKRIENVRPSIPLKKGNFIEIRGLHLRNLLVATRLPYEKESVHVQWAPLKVYRNELYEWSLERPSNDTGIITELTFNIPDQNTEIFFMGRAIKIQPQQYERQTIRLEESSTKVTFLVVRETDTPFMPIVIGIPIAIFLIQASLKLFKASFHE